MKDAGDVAEDFGDSLEDASSGADKLGSGLSVATVAMGNLISSGIQAALSGIQELGSAIWNPVSYTHLDVYKRQSVTCSAC